MDNCIHPPEKQYTSLANTLNCGVCFKVLQKHAPIKKEDDRGLAALAAALTDDWVAFLRPNDRNEAVVDFMAWAAAILGERGVFLPDGGDCGHVWKVDHRGLTVAPFMSADLARMDATIATLRADLHAAGDLLSIYIDQTATLRAALDGLVFALDFHNKTPAGMVRACDPACIACAALATARGEG